MEGACIIAGFPIKAFGNDRTHSIFNYQCTQLRAKKKAV
jgi:hypothetical protein